MAAEQTGGGDLLAGIVLVAAALTTGLAASVFGLYWHTVMPGLRSTDDRTFVGAFQALDRAIINPWFMTCFLGALILTGLAGGLQFAASSRAALPWIAVAFVLYLVTVVITLAVNVPLNDALKAAGDPDRIADLAQVRRDFQEARWVAWNVVRTVASTAAFTLLLVALLAYARRT
ncbi:DUF1772 domain-containing protein [Actinomycetes bacterium KLBMP 9797]